VGLHGCLSLQLRSVKRTLIKITFRPNINTKFTSTIIIPHKKTFFSKPIRNLYFWRTD